MYICALIHRYSVCKNADVSFSLLYNKISSFLSFLGFSVPELKFHRKYKPLFILTVYHSKGRVKGKFFFRVVSPCVSSPSLKPIKTRENSLRNYIYLFYAVVSIFFFSFVFSFFSCWNYICYAYTYIWKSFIFKKKIYMKILSVKLFVFFSNVI